MSRLCHSSNPRMQGLLHLFAVEHPEEYDGQLTSKQRPLSLDQCTVAHLVADGPALQQGTERKGKACDVPVEAAPIRSRWLALLSPPSCLSCVLLTWPAALLPCAAVLFLLRRAPATLHEL